MTTEPQLDAYLASVDKALGKITLGDRAEIVTEIKSHILSARERDASRSVQEILATLGAPETVAQRALTARGLKTSTLKWITLGAVGAALLVWKLSPLISFDSFTAKSSLRTGLADLFDDSVGGVVFDGEKILKPGMDTVEVPFSNGQMTFTAGKELSWKCKVKPGARLSQVIEQDHGVVFDFGSSGAERCQIEVPAGKKLKISGRNGRVDLKNPQGEIDAELINGVVTISPDPARHYLFKTELRNGMSDSFDSSDETDAIPISVKVTNGKIVKE